MQPIIRTRPRRQQRSYGTLLLVLLILTLVSLPAIGGYLIWRERARVDEIGYLTVMIELRQDMIRESIKMRDDAINLRDDTIRRYPQSDESIATLNHAIESENREIRIRRLEIQAYRDRIRELKR